MNSIRVVERTDGTYVETIEHSGDAINILDSEKMEVFNAETEKARPYKKKSPKVDRLKVKWLTVWRR